MKYSFLKNSWFLVLIFAVSATGGISRAADEKMPELKTLSGKTFRDVRITKVTPSEISIIHESGATRILIEDLPEEMKTKLGYDPVKATAHAESTAKAEAKAQAEERKRNELAAKNTAMLKNASQLYGRISLITDGVVVVEARQPNNIPSAGSSTQSVGGGGGYDPGPSRPKQEHPSIYGTFVVTDVRDLSKFADDQFVTWVIYPTKTTREIGGSTYKVCQYLKSIEAKP